MVGWYRTPYASLFSLLRRVSEAVVDASGVVEQASLDLEEQHHDMQLRGHPDIEQLVRGFAPCAEKSVDIRCSRKRISRFTYQKLIGS